MPTFQAEVRIMPRAGLLDPQGQAVEHALKALEFRMMFEVEGGTPSWCMKLLRHEAHFGFFGHRA